MQSAVVNQFIYFSKKKHIRNTAYAFFTFLQHLISHFKYTLSIFLSEFSTTPDLLRGPGMPHSSSPSIVASQHLSRSLCPLLDLYQRAKVSCSTHQSQVHAKHPFLYVAFLTRLSRKFQMEITGNSSFIANDINRSFKGPIFSKHSMREPRSAPVVTFTHDETQFGELMYEFEFGCKQYSIFI